MFCICLSICLCTVKRLPTTGLGLGTVLKTPTSLSWTSVKRKRSHDDITSSSYIRQQVNDDQNTVDCEPHRAMVQWHLTWLLWGPETNFEQKQRNGGSHERRLIIFTLTLTHTLVHMEDKCWSVTNINWQVGADATFKAWEQLSLRHLQRTVLGFIYFVKIFLAEKKNI